MKNFRKSIIAITVLFLVVASVEAQNTLCAKTKAKVTNGNVQISKVFSSTTGNCPRGSKKIYTDLLPTSSSISESIKTVDGSGSGLDADLIDGKDSADFTTITEFNTTKALLETADSGLNSRITAAESTIATLTSTDTSLTSRITTTETSISSLNTTTSNNTNDINTLTNETRRDYIIRVGISGGDYSSISSAITAASDVSAEKPYLIDIGPGIYTISSSINIPEGLHLRGSGRGVTIIQGAIANNPLSGGNGIFNLQQGAKISEMTIENTVSAISNAAVLTARNIIESNRDNFTSYQTVLDNVEVKFNIPGNASNIWGIYLSSADVLVKNSSFWINGGNGGGFGLSANGAGSPKSYIVNSDFYTNGVSGDFSLVSNDSSYADVRNSRIFSDGASGTALLTSGSATIRITHSSIKADNRGINAGGSGNIYSFYNVLNAADNVFSGSPVCAYTVNESGTTLDNACE